VSLFVLALLPLALWLFNPKDSDPFGRKTAAERVETSYDRLKRAHLSGPANRGGSDDRRRG
jgi:hypothetical protein